MSSTVLSDNGNKAIEDTYQKKTQLEHILLRPDSYVGSIKTEEKELWVYESEQNKMVERKMSYNPALYKIFDEILVNASDNKIRDPKMTCIKITIDGSKNMIKIWNNGKGIPVVMHKTENCYVPTLIFGHLLTSTNFNDDQKKVVGGRNGYGAKLCNIFSSEFVLETSSSEYKKSFKQTWKTNMTQSTEPIITAATKDDFTCVTFYPDLKRFGMSHLDKDIIDLFSRRAYDIAACTSGITVFLNGHVLPVKAFKDYVDLYIKDEVDHNHEPLKVVYEKLGDRWEIAMTVCLKEQFSQVSFVNSIATTKGGTHVNYVADQIAGKLLEIAKKKLRDDKQGTKLKIPQVKMNMWIFVKSLIENPSFDSQTKENMTLQAKDFGSECVLSDKFIAQAAKTGIVERMTMWAQFKNQALMDKKCSSKKQSKLKGIPKLDDANNAGTKNSHLCTLILTEGDSAKTLAVAGLSVIGRDNYGVFPLRGKLLNVREASPKQLLENAEINNLIKIIGLQYKQKYESLESMKTLRYGKIMIMTDQDQDGSHIKGLIINFIHTNWPNLLKNNFMEQFITPIIKATKGSNVLSFFSIPEYLEWLAEFPEAKTYHIKYYKGLGTSTGKEAKEYFNDMNRHLIKFKYEGIADETSIVLAFGKNKADERKEWLTKWMEECKRRRELGLEEEYLYAKNTKHVTYDHFVNKELVLFSNTDNSRSIPSVVDGLKPGQRKVMFACFKRNLVKEIKVAQLAGSVAELSSYHHGEVSLMGTIVNLAQDYVGSNNINLLEPRGQFGTRLHGGKDSASARYIFTQLNRLAKLIFHPDDMPIMNYLYDDNQKIEPEWYAPIIPMVLINGSDGIGTGWSSKIPNFNPKDIIKNVRNMIEDRPLIKMHPWYRGFKGVTKEICENRYVVSGEICSLGSNTLEIIELPVKTWTQSYKENVIDVFLNGSDKIPAAITDFKEYHTDTTVRFIVEMTPQKYQEAERIGFHKFFKLQTTLTCSNMVLFDELGVIRKYHSAEEIIRNFFKVRMSMYIKRKVYLEGMLAAVALRLQNQARFIVEKIEGQIVCENIKIKALIDILVTRKYDSDPVLAWKKSVAASEKPDKEDEEDENEEEKDATKPDFAYLTSMQIISLTEEKKDALLAERDAKTEELNRLRKKTPANLWIDDLDALEKALLEVEGEEKENSSTSTAVAVSSGTSKKKGKTVKVAAETAPSKFGVRIEPTIDDEVVKKINADVEKKKKVKMEKNQQQLMENHFMPQEDGDTNMSEGVRECEDTEMVDMRPDNGDDDDEPLSLAQRMAAQGLMMTKVAGPSKNGPKVVKEKKTSDPKKRKAGGSPLKKLESPAKKKKPTWESDSDNAETETVIKTNSNMENVSPKASLHNSTMSSDSDHMMSNEPKKPLKQMKLFSNVALTSPTKKTAKPKADPKPKAVPKPKAAAKPKAEPKPKVVKEPKPKAVAKPKVEAKPKTTKRILSSDEEEDVVSISSGEVKAVCKKPRREVKMRENVFNDDSEDDNVFSDASDSDFDIQSAMSSKNKKRARIIDSD